MTILAELNDRRHDAADYIKTKGWGQRELVHDDGRVCATGAVMYCQPKNGDEHLIISVMRHRDRAEEWNDRDGRTAEDVIAELNTDITDTDLEETFGPQWQEVVALGRSAAQLSPTEIEQLAVVNNDVLDTSWMTGWDAALLAREAVCDATLDVFGGAMCDGFWGTVRGAALETARSAVRDAAQGLVIRDLIGRYGLTQEHYNVLTKRWATAVGKVHPDDAAVTA